MKIGKELIVWAISGPFGGHRFLLRQFKTGAVMLSLALLQTAIIRFTYAEPFKAPWIYHNWPPVSALFNIKTAIYIIHPSPNNSDPEELLVAPAVWLFTLPSLVVTVWSLWDGLKLIIRVRNESQ